MSHRRRIRRNIRIVSSSELYEAYIYTHTHMASKSSKSVADKWSGLTAKDICRNHLGNKEVGLIPSQRQNLLLLSVSYIQITRGK